MKILILPGDGIGPEIMAATMAVLKPLNDKFGLGLDFVERKIGFAALEADGNTVPDVLMEEIKASDGVILGPVDTYAYPPKEDGGINPSAAVRVELDLYANIRPSRARDGVPCLTPNMIWSSPGKTPKASMPTATCSKVSARSCRPKPWRCRCAKPHARVHAASLRPLSSWPRAAAQKSRV